MGAQRHSSGITSDGCPAMMPVMDVVDAGRTCPWSGNPPLRSQPPHPIIPATPCHEKLTSREVELHRQTLPALVELFPVTMSAKVKRTYQGTHSMVCFCAPRCASERIDNYQGHARQLPRSLSYWSSSGLILVTLVLKRLRNK